MIATNRYLDLWKESATSLDNFVAHDRRIQIYLFTDQVAAAKNWASHNLKNISVNYFGIPSLAWPEATLFRYRIISQHADEFQEPVLMYLDSDMKIMRNIGDEFYDNLNPELMNLVIHPGFFNFKNKLQVWRLQPALIKRELLDLFLRKKFPGDWETSKKSTAYVSRRKRKNYVHGAIWIGASNTFLDMAKTLEKNVDQDLENGIIAKWHDESHLNWFAANHDVNILDSRFSWHEDYIYLRNIRPFVTTIRKNNNEFQIGNHASN